MRHAFFLVPLVAVLFAVPAAAAPKRGAKAARSAHPDVGDDQNCRGCHAQVTEEAFQSWSRGKHGEVLVTCSVCHGSTGKDFARKPASDRCLPCHASQLATLSLPFNKGKTCFTCHPAHALDPHGTGPTATGKTKDMTKTDLSSIAFPNAGNQTVPLTVKPNPPPAGAQAGTAHPQGAPRPSGAPDPARNTPPTPALPGEPTQNR